MLVSVDTGYETTGGEMASIGHPGIQSVKESALLIFIPNFLAKERTYRRIIGNCLVL